MPATATTNGRAPAASRPAPSAKPPDAYLGPTCEVCHTPWAAHPNYDENGKAIACAAARPAAGPTPAPPRMWAVLVRVPGDPSGEPSPTGDVVAARDEAEALAKAGVLCATGRVAVREVGAGAGAGPLIDGWRKGAPANVGAGGPVP